MPDRFDLVILCVLLGCFRIQQGVNAIVIVLGFINSLICFHMHVHSF